MLKLCCQVRMADHPKFSHTANWLGLPSLCPVLSSNHVWELAVLLELVPPVSHHIFSPPISISLPLPLPYNLLLLILAKVLLRI